MHILLSKFLSDALHIIRFPNEKGYLECLALPWKSFVYITAAAVSIIVWKKEIL
jgi:hypothetical protein